MPPVITVLRNGISNVGSVCNALNFLGVPYKVAETAAEVSAAHRLIFPGVGAFGAAMEHLNHHGLAKAMTKRVCEDNIPFLGICLGLQLLFEGSEESPGVPGLGWFKGQVRRLTAEPPTHRVPNIGWCQLSAAQESSHAFLDRQSVYFVHSFAADPDHQELISLKANHGRPFVAGIAQGHIQALQFHPEKSGTIGLDILNRFCKSL